LRSGSWDELSQHQYSDPVLWGWGANSPVEVYNIYSTGGNSNFAGCGSAANDALFDAALAAPTVDESFSGWQRAQLYATPTELAPWVWMANIDHLYFKRAALQVAAQKPHPHGHGWSLVNNVDQWTWS
jgi:peptide/nickel transport system substrate-binding protein